MKKPANSGGLFRGHMTLQRGGVSGVVESSRLLQVGSQLAGRQRLAVQVALTLVTTLSDDVGLLLDGFHTLGDDLHAQALTQLDNGAHDGRVVLVFQQVLHEAFVDLDLVQRQALQIAQRGVASTEVIDGDQRTGAAQAEQVLGGSVDVFHQAGFGDFQLQATQRQAIDLHQVVDHTWQLGVVQLHGGQVDCHAQLGEALIMPFAQLAAGLVENPFANRDDGAVLFCQRDKQIRRYKAVLRMLPTQQRLDTDYAVVAVVDLRLVNQVQLIQCQGVTQVFFQLAAAAHFTVDAGDIKLITVA